MAKAITPEVIYVEASGTRHNAKIVGYTPDGTLTDKYTGPKMTAAETGFSFSVAGSSVNDDEKGTVTIHKPAPITEYKAVRLVQGEGKNAKAVTVPIVDLYVDFGTPKKGVIPQFIGGVRHKSHVSSGGLVSSKPYFEALPAPVPTTEKTKTEK